MHMIRFMRKRIVGRALSFSNHFLSEHKTINTVLYIAVTEISNNVLKGAEESGIDGMVNGFHQGIIQLAMDPSLLVTAMMKGDHNAQIKFNSRPGIEESYIEGYIQAKLDVAYNQQSVKARVANNEVILENLPTNSKLRNEIVEYVKSFLSSEALLEGNSSMPSIPMHRPPEGNEWKIWRTLCTLTEHLFVHYSIMMFRKLTNKVLSSVYSRDQSKVEEANMTKKWVLGRFLMNTVVSYINGCLCRMIPYNIGRRILSGFIFSFYESGGKV